MRSINFAFIMAAYLFAIIWIFTKSGGDFAAFVVYSIALSPMAVLAFSTIRKPRPIPPPHLTTPNAFIAHFSALAASIVLIIFVRDVSGRDELMHFFDNYVAGWKLIDAAVLLGVSIVMGAGSVVVWTSYRFRDAKKPFYSDTLYKTFFGGAPESVRMLTYMYIFIFSWCLGISAITIIWPDSVMYTLILKMARASLPLALLLIIPMLRLPFLGLGLIVSLGGVFYLAVANVEMARASAFTGIPLAALIVFFTVRAIILKSDKEPAQPIAPAEQITEEDKPEPQELDEEPEKEKEEESQNEIPDKEEPEKTEDDKKEN